MGYAITCQSFESISLGPYPTTQLSLIFGDIGTDTARMYIANLRRIFQYLTLDAMTPVKPRTANLVAL